MFESQHVFWKGGYGREKAYKVALHLRLPKNAATAKKNWKGKSHCG